MAIIFITGLSGVGCSTALEQLEKEGYHTVDTDYGYVIEIVNEDGNKERVWDEEKIFRLLEQYKDSNLLISGCYGNQGKFYKYFDSVVLLKADLDVMLNRIDHRTSHNYGKSSEDRREILDNHENVLPLLEKSSDVIIDTMHIGIDEVCRKLEGITVA